MTRDYQPFDPTGERATARRQLASKAPRHLQNFLASLAEYSNDAEPWADQMERLGISLPSPRLLNLADRIRRRVRNLDYVMGIEDSPA